MRKVGGDGAANMTPAREKDKDHTIDARWNANADAERLLASARHCPLMKEIRLTVGCLLQTQEE